MLKFTDGIQIEISGKLRSLKLDDGWYVVGEGKLIPMDSQRECREYIEKQKLHEDESIS